MIPAILSLILAAFVITAIVILAVAAKSDHAPNHGLALVVEDPSPDEPDVELVDELPLRAQAIDVPREGVVPQDRRRVCTPCLDAWADREPSRICCDCQPVFGLRTVA